MEVLIYVLAPAKRVLGGSEASCVVGSVAARGCCSPFDASVGERSLAAEPGLAGASCLQRGCAAAVLVHGCSRHAPLQSSCVAAILMDSCSRHLAQLQYSCAAAIFVHLCDHHARPQSLCTTAGLVRDCSPCGRLQSPCMAAILVDSCDHLACCSTHVRPQSSCPAVPGWPWAGARGLITGAWPSALRAAPHLSCEAACHHPAPPLGSGAAQGLRRLGLSRVWPAAVCHLAGLHVQWSGNLLSPPPSLTHPGSFSPGPCPVPVTN